jgi:hypothetical protein
MKNLKLLDTGVGGAKAGFLTLLRKPPGVAATYCPPKERAAKKLGAAGRSQQRTEDWLYPREGLHNR